MSTPDPKKIVISLSEERENEHKSNWKIIKKLIDDTGFTCENYEFPPAKDQKPNPPLTNSRQQLNKKSANYPQYLAVQKK